MFTHIDVHFGKGGDTSAAQLESAATTKRKEYQAAHESFMRIVRELQGGAGPLSPRAAMLCEIERLDRAISAKDWEAYNEQAWASAQAQLVPPNTVPMAALRAE